MPRQREGEQQRNIPDILLLLLFYELQIFFAKTSCVEHAIVHRINYRTYKINTNLGRVERFRGNLPVLFWVNICVYLKEVFFFFFFYRLKSSFLIFIFWRNFQNFIIDIYFHDFIINFINYIYVFCTFYINFFFCFDK